METFWGVNSFHPPSVIINPLDMTDLLMQRRMGIHFDKSVVSEQRQLLSNCEIVWAKVQVVGANPLLISEYHSPSEHDQVSAA